MSELSIHELEAQHGEVLPEREALGTFTFGSFNHDHTVYAVNSANATQSHTFLSSNSASANQFIIN
jgi:hypothetical protein